MASFCLCSAPFNWRTPFGYFIAMVFEFMTVHCTLCAFTPVLSFFIGSGWLAITFIEDITNDLAQLNSLKTLNKNKSKELKERFCYIIRFHSDAKQLSCDAKQPFSYWNLTVKFKWFNWWIRSELYNSAHRFIDEFGKIYEFIISCLLLWSLLSLAVTLLLFRSQIVKYISYIITAQSTKKNWFSRTDSNRFFVYRRLRFRSKKSVEVVT